MAREEAKLAAAKQSYKSALAVGNRQEEARWANVIGDMYKNRGEYVEALKWLRIDYEVSTKYLPEKHLLPTCQSLGEAYLSLADYKHALIYQKKHLDLAKDSGDLVEQQRANTQLGRTYHEIFSKSEDDHSSVRNAKKYFTKAMQIAKILKEKPLPHSGSFIKEYIDAHNNIGMLEMDLDNLEESRRMLTRGLQICDEEEVADNDVARSRLHHNLGNVYTELRKWDKALEHIEKDIIICNEIGQCQGEAKGYINLGEVHFRCQKYEEAISCYQRAHTLAKSLQDENALALQIHQNIETVNAAMKVMDELKKEEQTLKKLNRNIIMERGTPTERKCLIKHNECLDRLLEKSSMILAWKRHLEFAKKKKTVSKDLLDKEKIADSYLAIGESYQKLRIFDKSLKWYLKGWEVYQSVRNLEGQALVKINIGNILDSKGNSGSALKAYEDGYRIAVEANLPSIQLSALENMHYIQMIRLDNIDEARRCHHEIDKLKQSNSVELKDQNGAIDVCSETDTEGENQASHLVREGELSPRSISYNASKSRSHANLEPRDEDESLISIFHSARRSSKLNMTHVENLGSSTKAAEALPVSLSKSNSSQHTTVGRKRVRVVLSDDEDDMHAVFHQKQVEDIATSDEVRNMHVPDGTASTIKDVSGAASTCALSSYTSGSLEENTSGYKSRSPMLGHHGKSVKSSGVEEIGDEHIMCKIGDDLVPLAARSLLTGDNPSTDSLKVEIACLYYLQLPIEKRSSGLLPIIQTLECDGRPLESMALCGNIKDVLNRNCLKVFIEGWVQKPLMKLYVDSCNNFSEVPNIKLLKRLYDLKVSEDEVIAADCDLQDMSIKPLLMALHTLKTVSMIDLSHNMLGNVTVEKLQQILLSSGQKYGGLSLDLHCNRFGAAALFQICECPVLFARLEMLNLSGNRLTDACGSYLSTILEKCTVLYSLNIERCSVTSRTIQKIADSIKAGSALTQLSIGENSPISANVLVHLLSKLETLKRFSELSLKGIKLSKLVIDSLCMLIEAACLSGLILGSTNTGSDGALKLIEKLSSGTQELVKLDLSYCNLTYVCVARLNKSAELIGGVAELNLGGNSMSLEGRNAITSLLMNPFCALKVVVLNCCQLGHSGLVGIIKTLEVNSSLEELNLAQNVDLQTEKEFEFDTTDKEIASATPSMDSFCDELKDNQQIEIHDFPRSSNAADIDYNELEVADSEDESIRDVPVVSKVTHKRSSKIQRNPSPPNYTFIQELSSAISKARSLKLLDLSINGISTKDVELLYSTWSGTRAGPSQKHVKDCIFHLSTQGAKCCGMRPCCRRDSPP
uniref:Protein TONSOKU n=1 Tax=Kalanchoe fedtschenkoi TaxID=63787 RepID=A0A7N0TWH9_KALFE